MYVSYLYETLGARLTILAFFMAFAWTLGMVMDIIVGYISGILLLTSLKNVDRIRSEYGRRRVLMLVGGLLYPAFTILLFIPPDLTERGYHWWFGVFFTLFFFSYSLRYFYNFLY